MIVDNKFTTFPVASRETHERKGRGHPLPGTPEMWLALSVPPAGADRTYAPKESPCSELRSWFPASRQAQPYRKLMVGARRAVRCRDGLHAVENVAAASSGPRTGEREVMPSPSAPMPDQRSSASAAGGEVHGEFGSRWQAAASGGGSAHNLAPLVWRGVGEGRTVAGVGSPFRSRR